MAQLEAAVARLQEANADLERDLVDALQRREYLVLDSAPVECTMADARA